MDTDLDHVGGCMANHSKFIKLLLSFVIAISPIILINNANASTQTIGGWSVVSNVGQGIGAKLTATKEFMVNGASKVVTGTANLTPNPSSVAKFMAKAGVLALADLAVRELMNGVDFVLDPANNEVRKKVSSGTATNDNYKDNSTGLTGDALCFQVAKDGGFSPRTDLKCTLYSSGTNSSGQQCFTASFYRTSTSTETNKSCFVNATYTKPEEKYEVIPISAIATQIIDKAEKDIKAGNVTSAVILTRSAVIEDAREAETDQTKARPIVQQLENTQSFATTETAEGTVTNPSVTDPVTGEVKPVPPSNIALDFPVFCGWAPSVCVAADVVVKAPAQILEQIETLKEWAKTEESTDTEIDIPDQQQQEIDTQVSFSSQCPANIKLADFSYHGISQSWDVDFSKFCDVFSTYLRPVVIAIGAFSAVLIVSGVGVRENV